ncbi:hypothetical protein R3P38DRAFT_2547440 [Favolaschia claudopus]|uniref:Uncharacterized protein n=1 Tax=Favolaschia claudopus TaxID=2862362 RepID=A0AAW0AJW0_9AGAR
MQSTVTFAHFSFEDAVKGNEQTPFVADTNEVNWMDDRPRMALSNDGYAVVVHLPGALKEKSSSILLNELTEFVKTGFNNKLPLSAGADGKTRDQKKSYKVRAGEIAGLCKLVRAWHAIGQPVSGDAAAKAVS